MNVSDSLGRTLLYASAAALCLVGLENATIPLRAQESEQDVELQMGQEVFDALKTKGEIVESSPLYDPLKPVAEAITLLLDSHECRKFTRNSWLSWSVG